MLASGTVAYAAENYFDKPVLHPAIPLVDEEGQHVLNSGKPYSTRMSCGGGTGGCHDIDKITRSYHFDMGRNESDDRFGAKRGVVPVVSPGYFGGYNCMLLNNPLWLSKKSNTSEGEFLDYGAPGLIKTCGACHNGGGFGEKDRFNNRYDLMDAAAVPAMDGDYYEWQDGDTPTLWDWKKSGVVEADCLLCHADFSQLKNNTPNEADNKLSCQDMDCSINAIDEWTDLRANFLFKNGFFRYANSSILKFLNVASEGDDRFLISSIDNLNGDGEPKLNWNPDAFDSVGKMQMPMLRFPDNKNCMQCHITSHERRGFYGFGDAAMVVLDDAGTPIDDYRDDVHKGRTWTEKGESRDIENCNACHSKQYYKATYLNVDIDADHNFLIGNSDQDVRRDLNFNPGALTCEHCHGGKAYGSSEKPALPSGHATILDAHRERWKARGDMLGYPASTLDRVTQVHLDVVTCQTCHIPNVNNEGEPIKIRYRYHETEDGLLKMAPYQATPRYYWWDKNNQRIISRRERLQVAGSDTDPQTYDEVKQLKAGFDALLKEKGYKNADSQMVWTESNDYLITHNTKPSVLTMPCTDCHDRKSNGSISSLITPNGVLGEKNTRVVASMADSKAYSRLVDEGVVKLDMPYFSIDNTGAIVENVSDILYETKLEPFTTALRASTQDTMAGEFGVVSADDAVNNIGLQQDATAVSVIKELSQSQLFQFSVRITSNQMKQAALLVGYNEATKGIVPNYSVEISAKDWTAIPRRINKRKVKEVKKYKIKQGLVTSSVFDFTLRDQQLQAASKLGGHQMLLKLPYAGRATNPKKVGFRAVSMDSTGARTNKRAPKVAAEIISVKPGNTLNYGYVVLLLNELPEHGVLFDKKKRK